MKNKFKVLSLVFAICFCFITFAGCTMPFNNVTNKHSSSSITNQYSENETIITEKTTSASQIAQKYIDISFTVCINQVVETTQNGNTQTSEKLSSYGSGFIVHKGGFILTNNHVIDDVLMEPVETTSGSFNKTTTKTYYKCYVSQDGGSTIFPAKILWNSSNLDMAIIVCENFASLPAAKLKDRTVYCSEKEKIQLLEEVITVGNQKSYYASATTGTISSTVLRMATSESNLYQHLIQHNAAINHGNSGGALIDMDGNVIGLNTLGDDDANSLFFAVSIYPAIAVLDKVVDNYYTNGKETTEITLGIKGVDAASDSISSKPVGFNNEGVYVLEVEKTCLISGLLVGDVIIGVEIETTEGAVGFEIWDNNSFLYAKINLLYAQNATFKVKRGGSIVTLTM